MQIKSIYSTIDTHTAGGPTRIITNGVPPLKGDDVAAKMSFFRSHYDAIRTMTMREPRGHSNMSGAVLTSPTHPEADVGAFFITASGYLPACVHSTIGIAVAGLTSGFISADKLQSTGRINMEVPAGLISITPVYEDNMLLSVAVQTAPAFVLAPKVEIRLGKSAPFVISIVFSGVFFALVDVHQISKLGSGTQKKLNAENSRYYAMIGAEILDAANRACDIRHPEQSEPRTVDFVMFYEQQRKNQSRNIVINANGSIDRTPCGAGMGAKLAELTAVGQLASNDVYVLESFLGTRFTGRVVELTKVGTFDAVVPQIEGMAYITGVHQFMLDSMDPIGEGLDV